MRCDPLLTGGFSCHVAIDTRRPHGGDAFKARFIGPAIVGATVKDLCGGRYEAAAVLVDAGEYHFELYFEALSYSGYMGSVQPAKGKCIEQPKYCPPVRLGATTMRFLDYIAWHNEVHSKVLGQRVALLPVPTLNFSKECEAFKRHPCSGSRREMAGRWVRSSCITATPHCVLGNGQLIREMGAEYVWVPWACVLRIYTTPEVRHCLGADKSLVVVGKSTSRNVMFELANLERSTPLANYSSEHMQELNLYSHGGEGFTARFYVLGAFKIEHLLEPQVNPGASALPAPALWNPGLWVNGLPHRPVPCANPEPSGLRPATAVIINDGLWAIYASEPLASYVDRLSRRVKEFAGVAAKRQARLLWRSTTVVHTNVERLSMLATDAEAHPNHRGKVCQTTNSVANTVQYNEAAARVMDAYNVSIVDVFPITTFRWDRSYDCMHFFPCDACGYAHKSLDFERSNSVMVTHAILTGLCGTSMGTPADSSTL